MGGTVGFGEGVGVGGRRVAVGVGGTGVDVVVAVGGTRVAVSVGGTCVSVGVAEGKGVGVSVSMIATITGAMVEAAAASGFWAGGLARHPAVKMIQPARKTAALFKWTYKLTPFY